ncbi:MAG: patatin [Bacteroidetes bacterium]|nr:MAG: patatin [Bacteroidota bacterium]
MKKRTKLFRILSIDGGGIRGIIPGQIIVSLEKKIQTRTKRADARIADYFDLLAGTSTGGILTCIYLTPGDDNKPKFSAGDAVQLYLNRGGEIFDISIWQKLKSAGGLLDEKYNVSDLQNSLKEYFGDLKLNQLLKPCLIPAYEIFAREAKFFNKMDAKNEMYDFYVRDVARATSAAPTYFECARIQSMTGVQYFLVDGGVFANNPSLCAYAEVRNKLGPKAADMAILSLGTGFVKTPYMYKDAKDWGLLEWAKPLIDIMMSGVSETVDYQLRQMFDAVGKPNQYLRINSPLTISNSQMDNASEKNLLALKEEGTKIAEQFDKKLDEFVQLLIKSD